MYTPDPLWPAPVPADVLLHQVHRRARTLRHRRLSARYGPALAVAAASLALSSSLPGENPRSLRTIDSVGDAEGSRPSSGGEPPPGASGTVSTSTTTSSTTTTTLPLSAKLPSALRPPESRPPGPHFVNDARGDAERSTLGGLDLLYGDIRYDSPSRVLTYVIGVADAASIPEAVSYGFTWTYDGYDFSAFASRTASSQQFTASLWTRECTTCSVVVDEALDEIRIAFPLDELNARVAEVEDDPVTHPGHPPTPVAEGDRFWNFSISVAERKDGVGMQTAEGVAAGTQNDGGHSAPFLYWNVGNPTATQGTNADFEG